MIASLQEESAAIGARQDSRMPSRLPSRLGSRNAERQSSWFPLVSQASLAHGSLPKSKRLPGGLPAAYPSLCTLCSSLLASIRAPVLVAWDAIERLRPPPGGDPYLAWIPSPLPQNVCILFTAVGDPSTPTVAAATDASLSAAQEVRTALSGQAPRLRVAAAAAASVLEETVAQVTQ